MAHAPLQQHAFITSSLIDSEPTSNHSLFNPQPTLINPQLILSTPFLPCSGIRSTKLMKSRPAITSRRLQSRPSSNSSSKLNSSMPSQTSSSAADNQSIDIQSSDHRQLLHHFSLRMILEVITFIWRLPGIISRFLKKEEKLLDTIEDDINEAADVVKMGSKVVEGLAEGIEKVAEAIDNKEVEEVAKTVEEDAKRVEVMMDKVKAGTKVAHDEIEEVASSLGESLQGVEKAVAKVRVKAQEVSTEETTKTSSSIVVSPLQTSSTNHNMNAHTEHRSFLEDLMKAWQGKCLIPSVPAIASSLRPILANYNYAMPSTTWLKALIMGSLLMYLLVPLQPLLVS